MKITNVFVGTVGQDPRSGAFEDGRHWANVRIAVNHDYFNGATGEVVNRGVSWFDVSAYGALARNLAFSVRKGDSIIVVGELRMRDWEKDGRTGTSGTIVADVVGPNLLFGVSRYTRSSALNPDTPEPEEGDGSGGTRESRRNGAWGKLGAPTSDRSPAPGGGSSGAASTPSPVAGPSGGATGGMSDVDGSGEGLEPRDDVELGERAEAGVEDEPLAKVPADAPF